MIRGNRRLQFSLAGAAVLLVVVGGLVYLLGASRPVHRRVAVGQSPTPQGSPLPPAAVQTPAVLGVPVSEAGQRIKLPELGIDLPLIRGDGVTVPYYKAMIDPALSPPGDGIRSMVYAHAQTGMFGPLFHAHVGNHIEIDLAGGRVLHYTITQYYPHWPVADRKWFDPVPHEELILVTCTTFNSTDPRIIVVAEPSST